MACAIIWWGFPTSIKFSDLDRKTQDKLYDHQETVFNLHGGYVAFPLDGAITHVDSHDGTCPFKKNVLKVTESDARAAILARIAQFIKLDAGRSSVVKSLEDTDPTKFGWWIDCVDE